jgi:hypothetical protein
MKSFKDLREKTLTPAEKKKREEIAKAMERENPGMDMKKKMAIATWQAKKVAEETLDEDISKMPHGRLKWHMNSGVPHGRYTSKEMKAERDRRLKTGEGEAYKKAKPVLEEVELDEVAPGFEVYTDPKSGKPAVRRTPTAVAPKPTKATKTSANNDNEAWKEKNAARRQGRVYHEEVELDEISKSTLSSYVKKAKKSNPVTQARKDYFSAHGKLVKSTKDNQDELLGNLGQKKKDFDKADADRKSRLKYVKLAKKKLAKEEVELDEVSDKKLDAYRQKAFADQPAGDDGSDKYRKRKFGRDLAFAKQTGRAKVLATKEEVEQVDEISRDLARRYIRKVADKTNTGELSTKEVEKRRPGLNLAGKKAYPGIAGKAKVSATEAVEPIDEISKKTLGSYIKKAKDDLGNREAEVTRNRYVDPRGVKDPVKHNNTLLMKRAKRRDNINKAVDKLTREQAEDDMPASPDEKSMAMSQAKFIEYVAEEIKEYIEKDKPFPEWMQNKLSSLHENAKNMHAVLAGDYEDEDEMEEAVQSADRKSEKYIRPDGKIGIRMVKVDKKVLKEK